MSAAVISISPAPCPRLPRRQAEVITTRRLRLLYALEYTLLEQLAAIQKDIAAGAVIEANCPYCLTGYTPQQRIVLDITDPPAA